MRRDRLGWSGALALAALVGCGGGGSGAAGGHGGTGSGGTGGPGSAGAKGSGGGSATGGATGAGGGFTTSVPGGTKLGGLTPAQGQQLCADVQTYVYGSLVHPLCDAIAAEIGPQKAYQDLQYNPAWTDADVRADCLAARPEAGACDDIDAGMMNTCDPSTFSALPATCTATVSDYGACLSAIGPDYDSYAGAAPTCATLTVAGLRAYFATDGGGSLGPASPAPCLTFSTGGACAGTPMPGGGSKK